MSQLSQIFTNIANAIRGKTGSNELITPPEMATAIDNIPSGGGLPDKMYYYPVSREEPNYEGNYLLLSPTTINGLGTYQGYFTVFNSGYPEEPNLITFEVTEIVEGGSDSLNAKFELDGIEYYIITQGAS